MILDTKIGPCSVYSDDSYVSVRLALTQVCPRLGRADARSKKGLKERCFVEALANSPVVNKCQTDDGDHEFALLSSEIKQISDDLVSAWVIYCKQINAAPSLKRFCREMERIYRNCPEFGHQRNWWLTLRCHLFLQP
ncbi:hypothetical protein HELRODRAFT_167494 [Helobdella robusta]|uniref:Uncharacterized protein n=1 Tax=Helobdella robusta TaxID=6412 RepID=T1EZF5_HELRO|nr:hypothetical protein HELRODRAFT_167494 [Helobdella robusta]ESO10977.1 hypothetical protein HELRODRAFT_167494 [Helobdella robusta]